VTSGQNGFVFSPNDPGQFAAALTDAAALDPPAWRRSSAAAARSVREITPTQVAERFRAVLERS